MEVKKELKLFQELKDEAYSIKDDSVQSLKEKNSIYDIDPIINYNLLNSLLEKKDEEFIDKYLFLIQTLTFKQKIDINKKLSTVPKLSKKIKNLIKINNNSYIDNYFSVLKIIYNYLNIDDFNYTNFDKILKTDYYVDNSQLKIPLIYGTKELNFSSLINNIYHYFILYNESPEKNENNDNINNITKKIVLETYPDSILEKRNDNIKNTNQKMEIENEKKQNEEIKVNNKGNTNNNKNEILDNKCRFIKPILDIIFENDEFFKIFEVEKYKKEVEINNFQNGYKLKPNIDALYFHLLFIDFIMCIYSIKRKDNFLTEKIVKKFFEKKKEKLNSLKHFSKYVDIETNDGKKISFKKLGDIKNETYICYDKNDRNNFFSFNPYEHILSYINYINFESFKQEFNNEEYFSLLKFYKINHLFKNPNLEEKFKDNIKDMLQSTMIDELFSEFSNFSKFKNPYKSFRKNDFVDQVFEVILYFPFPVEKIGGFTYKNSGLIFINNVNDKKKFVDSTLMIYDICTLSIDKVTLMHEIITHYTSTICHANDKKNELITPPNSFKNYFPKIDFIETYDSYDAGDRAEALIFGNKIKTLFIRGALFILNKDNWNNFTDIETFKTMFISVNKFDENNKSLDILSLKEENILIKELLSSYYNTGIIQLNKRNSYFVFRSMDDKDKIENEEDFNICWERINKTQLPYQKIELD